MPMHFTERHEVGTGGAARLVFAAALAVALALAAFNGCTMNPATGRPALTGLTSTADENRIGREQHPQIVQACGGTYDDPKVAAYVARVGQALARGTERPDITYTFTVLDTPIVNALATPGGYYLRHARAARAGR
jgi:predicted Zn-dependent protease